MTENVLRVSLLGPLLVATPDRDLLHSDFGGRKPRELLARLALARNTPVSKGVLAEQLWPANAPKSTTATLESYISVLRKRLFADGDKARRVLSTSGGGYRLATDELFLDLDRFDELIRNASDARSLERNLELRLEAVALHRGDLLEDLVDSPWAESDRRVYRDRVVMNLLVVAESQLMSSGFPGTIWHAEAALRVQPYAEEASRLLMLAHYAMGHEDCAREAFERCRKRIATDLDRDCTSATEELASAIDAGEPPSQLIRASSTLQSSLRSSGTAITVSAPDNPSIERRSRDRRMLFVGRQAELVALTSMVERSFTGQLTAALITGAHGMGKTALVDQLESRFWTVVGRSEFRALAAVPQQLPLAAPLINALERRGAAGAATAYASGPFLHGSPEALAVLAEVLHDRGPLVFLLDDLDLADAGTIEGIRWLQTQAGDLPLAIVATSYPNPRAVTNIVARIAFDTVIALQPLEVADVELLGPQAEEVRRLCGGNPLLMVDLWRWIQSGANGVPQSLHERVKNRARGLSQPLVEVMQILSRLPEPVEPAAIARLLRLPVRQVEHSLASLSMAGLVDIKPEGVRFEQPVVRRILAEIVAARSLVAAQVPKLAAS